MSRLSARNREMLTFHTRSAHLSTAFLSKRKTKPQTAVLRSAKPAISNLQLNLDPISDYYNVKEGKFDSPLTGPITIPRGTFQLSVPHSVKLAESRSAPQIPAKPVDAHLALIDEMNHMIPKSRRSRRNLKNCLRTSVRQLTNLRLRPEDLLLVNKLLPQLPLGRPQSRFFLQCCKEGNTLQVEVLLAHDRYLAHVFDPMRMTALHWAALRGYQEIASLLLAATAFVDAVDCVNDM
jgi:hypothetical protein